MKNDDSCIFLKQVQPEIITRDDSRMQSLKSLKRVYDTAANFELSIRL